MRFTKMHSCGNDYVFIQTFTQTVTAPEALAEYVSRRHFGVGSDGMILLCPSGCADFRMRVFNPDGSEAEMCGNALRSAAMLFYEKGFGAKTRLAVETIAGIKQVSLLTARGRVISVTAHIGEARLDCESIPVLRSGSGGGFIGQPLRVLDRSFTATAMSFGNPHCAVLCDDVDTLDISRYGSAIECLDIFPRRTNVEFFRVESRTSIVMRTWERRCGETLACATGACCCTVAGILAGLLDRNVTVRQLGGEIRVYRDRRGCLHMTGVSKIVFDGTLYGFPPEEE